jgi:hypothetical protein
MGYGITPRNLYEPQQQSYQSGGGLSSAGGGFLDTLQKIPDPLYTFGGGLLGRIGGLIAGKSDAQKLQERLAQQQLDFGKRRGRYASQLLNQLRNPGQFTQGIQQQMSPFLNKLAQGGSQRVGLGSGAYQGEMLRQGQGMFAKLQSDRTGQLEDTIARMLG